MTRPDNSTKQMAKAERLSKALRDNLKRRKAQLRGRGAASTQKEPVHGSDAPDAKKR